VCSDGFGHVDGGGFRPSFELALIPNMMYLPRVKILTQFKSESLKPIENETNESEALEASCEAATT